MEKNISSNSEGTLKKRPLPSFVKKLWFILADIPSHEYIFWVDNGQVICVPNASSFSKVILPRFFKHSNWQSFVRQLNLYGFRKVYQLNLSYDESTEKRTVWQFKHECFRNDNPEKLCEIKRRASKGNQHQQQLQQQLQQQQNILSISSTAQPNNNNNNNNTLTFHNNNNSSTNNNQPTSGLNGESMQETLIRFQNRLEQVDRKRKELWEQTFKLSQIQARQQKAIRVLVEFIMQYLNEHPDSENDRLRFANIMQRVLEQDTIEELLPSDDNMMMMSSGEGEEEEEEDDDDDYITPPPPLPLPSAFTPTAVSSSSSQHIPQQQQQQQTTLPVPQPIVHPQPTYREDQPPNLPSISDLMTDHSNHILPPLRKRPNNRRN